jgi:hypothetical protein
MKLEKLDLSDKLCDDDWAKERALLFCADNLEETKA